MSRMIKRTFAAFAVSGIVAVQAAQLETPEQRFSYTLGYQFAQQLKSQDVFVDGASFGAALDDMMQGREPQLTLEQMREAMQAGREATAKAKQVKAEQALATGKKFLEENAKKEGVVTLPSGLQYKVLASGEGENPKADSKVTVHYRGTLINGKEFDSSYGRGEPTTFSLGGVIPGFREAISLMKPGAKWQVFIPSELGYGANGAGAVIGANETLIFEIELISIAAVEAAEAAE